MYCGYRYESSKAAAVVTATIPGLCLCYDGQFSGYKNKVPVQLARANEDIADDNLRYFYNRLLSYMDSFVVQEGVWDLLESFSASDGDESYTNILCWQWKLLDQYKVVIANYSSSNARARVRITLTETGWSKVTFTEFQENLEYVNRVEDIEKLGLYVELEPWDYHLFEIN